MKATLTLTESDIRTAIKEHVNRQGWKFCDAKLVVNDHGQDSSGAAIGVPFVTAEVSVEPRPPTVPSPYDERG